jgi:hypothetical protein
MEYAFMKPSKQTAMSKIFLNYRRDDSAAFARRLYDNLVEPCKTQCDPIELFEISR